MKIHDFTSIELIAELRDRGFAVLDQADQEGLDETLEGVEILVDLIGGLRAAVMTANTQLQIALIDALIVCAGHDQITIEMEIQSQEQYGI